MATCEEELKELRIKYYTLLLENVLEFAEREPELFDYYLRPIYERVLRVITK